jgi:hypothetical protein
MTSAKVVRQCTAACSAALVALLPFSAIAATCGHDVHGAPRIEETKLAPNNSIITYFSPATVIMDNPSDPRHRAFGECRGQGVVTEGVPVWQGGCTYKSSDGDVFWINWSSKPGDTGTENRDAPKGTGVFHGTGKFQGLNGKTGKWTGLANGGSYFCDDSN